MADLRLLTDRMDDSLLDTALSTAVLEGVAAGTAPPSLRLFIPRRVVAFGSQDATRDRYPEAVAAVRALGFDAVERLAGGKAAVFHEATIAFAWATPEADSKVGIEQRFERIGAIVVDALSRLGVRAAIGETPGEYCPGRFSVHAGGRKVMGVGQRLVRGAAHVGGVLVAEDPELVNEPLRPAYDLLAYDWDPAATGAIGSPPETVIEALRAAFAGHGHRLVPDSATTAERTRAADLAERHRPPIA
jgi:lipoate-protein ligase A